MSKKDQDVASNGLTTNSFRGVNQPSYNTEMKLTDADIKSLIGKIKEKSRYDFTNYSEKSFRRRIEKILVDHDLSIDSLSAKMYEDADFLEQIVKEITVNTTELFRDKDTWMDILEFLKRHFKSQNEVKIWSAGCSNGLEIYSLVILLNELGVLQQSSIYGTDLNTAMIKRAKDAEYPFRHDNDFFEGLKHVIGTISPNPSIEKYFNISPKSYKCTVKPQFKSQIKYAKHNLVELNNPFDIKFDLILCRNVLIYFNHNLQEKLFYFFHRQLHYNGALVLGVHEGMLGPVADKYMKIGQVYNRL